MQRVEGQHVLRRVLAFENHRGASERELEAALAMLQDNGPAAGQVALDGERAIGELTTVQRFALEIDAQDTLERELLYLEVNALEMRWEQEESLAEIIDGELTPLPAMPSKLRRRGGRR